RQGVRRPDARPSREVRDDRSDRGEAEAGDREVQRAVRLGEGGGESLVATLRDIRRRIRSIGSTAQITKTMEMVSAAKLRRAQVAVESARPYATQLREVLANLAQASSDVLHPAFTKREVKRRAIVLVTSDRGLCGAFNANLIRAAEVRMRERPEPTALILIG